MRSTPARFGQQPQFGVLTSSPEFRKDVGREAVSRFRQVHEPAIGALDALGYDIKVTLLPKQANTANGSGHRPDDDQVQIALIRKDSGQDGGSSPEPTLTRTIPTYNFNYQLLVEKTREMTQELARQLQKIAKGLTDA